MSWLFERFAVSSAVNGTIRCRRWFGRWTATVDGCDQTSPYLCALWKDALRRLPRDLEPRRILLLGLGTGATVRMYRKRFPKAGLTAVELDPAMAALAERLAGLRPEERPNLLIGDAAKVVPTLPGPYDLVVFDLFIGRKAAATDTGLAEAIFSKLDRRGALLVNGCGGSALFEDFKKCGRLAEQWRFDACNRVVLFRPLGAGTLGDPLPREFRRALSCEAYLRREFTDREPFAVLNAGTAVGVRRLQTPFNVDHFQSETEPGPLPAKTARHRLVFWQAIERAEAPPGWRRWPFAGDHRLTGFARLPTEGPYHLGWSEHARRHRTRWLKQTTHEIVDADLETYLAGLARSKKTQLLVRGIGDGLRLKAERHGERLRLRIVRDRGTGAACAGFASLWIPEIAQTFHVSSFVDPASTQPLAAVGLMDDCFRIAQARGDLTLDFDSFWAPGEPASWKGFSRFKAQFDVYYVRWPRPWFRWE